jgi:thiamine biosynthesis lipoprotein
MKYSFSLLIIFLCLNAHAQVLRKRTTLLMGSRFDISIVAENKQEAENNIDAVIAEVERIENLISDWRANTQVSQINKNAGIKPVKVDKEVFELTKRALHLSKITNGAFDISFAAMDKIWKFDGTMTKMPSQAEINKARAKVGYKNIILDEKKLTIYLKLKGMKIGFGALGEGYAADKCRAMMLTKGVKSGIVNGSGDMSTWGTQPDGSKWNIGITNPNQKDSLIATIPLYHQSIVTSGSYQKFVEFNGKRYSHIINPKTGHPSTGLTSVTVIGPSTELANGLSTSIMVLGKTEGLKLIKKLKLYNCLMITDNGGIIKSKNFNSIN